MRNRCAALVAGLLVLAKAPTAQPVFTGAEIFPPEEFAARRARVMTQIGDAVAILQGTTERAGEQPFRQSNQFFYLTGASEYGVDSGRLRRLLAGVQPGTEHPILPPLAERLQAQRRAFRAAVDGDDRPR